MGGNPAQTEAWALIEAAKRMAASIVDDNRDAKTIKDARKAALRLNWRLWTIFQSELTLEHSEVPNDLRINMLTLCKFVDKHTVGALAKPTPEALAVLIDINRNIAAGLAQVPESVEKEAEPVSADEPVNAQAPDEPSASPPQPESKPVDLDV